MPDGWNDWKECEKCAEFIVVLTPLLYYKVGQGDARCQGKWLKSCVRILREIENENAVFARWKTKKWVKKLRKGIFRVGVWHVLRLDRPSFELRLGMFCTSVRHLSQCLKWNTELRKLCEVCKLLVVNKLRKCAKNGVFRPKHFVVEKKCVDWCIDCCVFWRTNPSGAPCVTTSPWVQGISPNMRNGARFARHFARFSLSCAIFGRPATDRFVTLGGSGRCGTLFVE